MNQPHNFLKQQYEEMLRREHEEKERKEFLTAGELISILQQVDPNSIIKISDWDNYFTIKNTNINSGSAVLYTFKN